MIFMICKTCGHAEKLVDGSSLTSEQRRAELLRVDGIFKASHLHGKESADMEVEIVHDPNAPKLSREELMDSLWRQTASVLQK